MVFRIVRYFKWLLLIGVMGLMVLAYCYRNFQFWTHVKTDNFDTLEVYHSDHIRGLRGSQILIHQDFTPHLDRVDKLAADYGIVLIVNSSYRSEPVNATQSNHMAGYSIDMNPRYRGKLYFSRNLNLDNFKNLPKNLRKFLEDVEADRYLRWGGHFDDPVHIDVAVNKRGDGSWEEAKRDCLVDYKRRRPRFGFLPRRLSGR